MIVPRRIRPGDDHTVGHRTIGARVELGARIGKLPPWNEISGLSRAAQSEAARRIEQVVAAVIAEAQRRGGNEESPRVLDARAVENAALVGRRATRRRRTRSTSSAR